MRKNLILISLLVFLVFSSFTLAIGAEKVVKIPSWWAPHEIRGAEKFFDEEFTPKTGIKVQYEYIGESYFEKLWTRIASGNPYDIMTFNADMVQEFIDKGALMPLDDLIKRDKYDLRDFFPITLEHWRGRKDGKLYGLSNDMGSFHFYYNANLFKSAGLPFPKYPWTWDKFLSYAQRLTKDANGDGRIDQWGYIGAGGQDAWNIWSGTNGAFLFNKEVTKCLIDDPKVIKALQFYQDLTYKYKVAPPPELIQLTSGDTFLAGNVAMMLDGTWQVGYLRDKGAKFDWDVVLPPRGPDTDRIYIPNFTAGWVISKGAKDPEAAWAAMKSYASKEFAEEVMFKTLSSLPTRRSALRSGKFYQWPERPPKGLTPEFYGQMIKFGEPIHHYPYNLGPKIRATLTKLDLIGTGQKPAEPVCKEVAKEVNELLKEMPWVRK